MSGLRPRPPYLELLRPANVLTACADIFAGHAVAGPGAPAALAWLLPASACLYAGGVVLNDYFDRDLDAVERPERPIPSGRVAAASAAGLGSGLLATGVLLAAGAGWTGAAVAAGTAAAILIYDARAKRHPFWGPVAMGACRGLNLVLEMAGVPAALAARAPLALLSLVYITAVTAVSRGEVRGGRRPVAVAALISLSAVLGALVWLNLRGTAAVAGLILCAALALRVLPPFWRVTRTPEPTAIRTAVRTGVLSLVLLDAALAVAFAGALAAVPILATGLAAGWLARRFAVT